MDSKKIDCIYDRLCVNCDSVGICRYLNRPDGISLVGQWDASRCVLQKAGFSCEKEVDWFGVTFQALHASTASIATLASSC